MSHQPGPYRGGGRGGGGDRGGRSHQSGPQRGGGDRGGFGGGRGQEQGPYRGRGDRGGFSGGRGQQPAPYRGGGDGDRVGRGGRGPVSSTPHPTSSSFNQSAPTPAPTSKPTREVGSSSSSASSATVDQTLATELKTKLTLPTSSKGVRTPPVRPGFGKAGKQCVVKANHFLVSLQDREFHHYDVSITPEVVSRKLNRIAMTQLVKLYGNSHLNGLQPVYDGRKGLYTAGPLPFENKDFHVKWKEGSREREFKVAIKLVGKPHVHHLLEFLSRRQREAPMDVIQVLDIVLRETPSQSYTSVGRSFYDPKFGQFMVGDGLEGWKGYYQSLRPTQMGLSLNIDVAATAFNEGIPVIDYVQKLINPRDPSRPLSPMDCAKIKKALRGLRVELTHTKGAKQHKVSGITPLPTNQLTFPDASGQQIFVTRYYLEKYKINLRFGHWPAIHAGSNSRPAYLPFEVCKVIPGQRFTKKLNERQVTAILKAACQRPSLREANISDIAEHNNYSNDEFAKRFGITVNPSLTIIQDARILPAPMLKYHDSGKDRSIQPNIGQWNMINAKMVNGAAVKYWTCVNFSRLHHEAVSRFVETLVSMCNKKGMNFNPRPLIPIDRGHADRIEQTLFEIHNLSTERLNSLGVQGNLELLIIILPDFTGTYGTIKRICETELGIVSQCCKPLQVSKNSPQYHENVALKINVKAGGRNTVLADALQKRIPLVTDAPTIIFGADVTHPSPGEDSSPSIAAVVASMDWPEVTKYRALVSTQKPEEIINELEAMVRTLMRAFRRSTGCKPQRIIFYRDGVGEGQFSEVLLKEVDAVMKACQSIEEGYLPPITFVIVQKRHHTRLFPADHSNRRMTDKSGNILPGTVVDTQICHPSEFDFYLCSHAGIQGTSRPTHYHVLWDQNGFTADQIQTLTNNLCYTYARCTRSVSIVPPAYYAHLAAFRARYYVEDVMVSESGNSRGGEGVVRPLPVIKDNVKDVMFYC